MKTRFAFGRALASAGSVLVLLLLAAPARAAQIDYASAYSRIFVDSVAYDSVLGLTQTLPTSFQGQPITINSLTSTPSTNVLGLTAASSSIAGTIFDPNNGLTSAANASAYANLATGTVGAGAAGSAGQAGGQIQDSITFNNTAGHTVNIDVSWTFDGTFPAGGFGGIDSFFCLGTGTSCVGGNLFIGAQPPPNGGQFFRLQDGIVLGSPTVTDPSTSQWVSATFTQGANAD